MKLGFTEHKIIFVKSYLMCIISDFDEVIKEDTKVYIKRPRSDKNTNKDLR